MIARAVLLISAFLIVLSGFAQINTDKNASTEKSTMEILDEANKLSSKNASKSMKLALEALEYSLNIKDKPGEYYAYTTLGSLYYNIGNYARATYYFTKARNGFTTLNNEKGRLVAEKHLALSLEKENKYLEAIQLNESKEIAYSNSNDKARGKYDKARLKSKAGNKKEALKDLENLSKDSTLSTENKIDIYKELGDLYVEKKDTAKAYIAYNQVLNFDYAPSGSFSLPSSNKTFIEVAGKLSDLNLSVGRPDQNIELHSKLLEEGLKTNNIDLLQTASYNLGNTYLEKHEEQTAISFLNQSVDYSKKNGDVIHEQKSVKALAKAYENIGNYDKALGIYKRYIRVTDSLLLVESGSRKENLALNQEFLKQEARIKGLMSSQKEKEASLKRQRTIVWTLTVVLLIFALLTWALVRNIKQKQKANMLVKLQSLRTQMNPHFIFNSLNSVNNFIAKNDELSANKYLSDFSKLMRSVLKNSDQDFVGLATEIETLKIYLELEHFRFGDKFEFSLTVADDIEPESVQVPPMLIQPYIENAIWHGLRYKEDKGILEVKFFIENTKLYCTIYDNGIGRKRSSELKTDHQKSYQSTGIKNTKERIEILNKLHKTSLGINITDLEQAGVSQGTLVKISIPFIMNEVIV